MVSTPNIPTQNIGFEKQVFGANINTWGIPEDNNWDDADRQLGGSVTVDVSGAQDVTIDTETSLYFHQILVGTLTGNINYVVPNKGRRYIIDNRTTGGFQVNVLPFLGQSGVISVSGQVTYVLIDPTDGQGTAISITSALIIVTTSNIRTVTTSQTLLKTDGTVLVDASGGPVTISLPSAAIVAKQTFIIKKIDASSNLVTVTPLGGAIDETGNSYLAFLNESASPQSDGANYWIT